MILAAVLSTVNSEWTIWKQQKKKLQQTIPHHLISEQC